MIKNSMPFHQWIRALAIIGGAGFSLAVFLWMTAYSLIGVPGFGLVRLQRTFSISLLQLSIVSISAFLGIWLIYSLLSIASGARPWSIVFKADARSYLFWNLLLIDVWRFIPGIGLHEISKSESGILIHRIIVLLTLMICTVFVKYRQRLAIKQGNPQPRPGIKSVTKWTVFVLFFAWIPSWIIGSNEKDSNAGIHSQMTWESSEEWLAGQSLDFNEISGFLPRGTYSLKSQTPFLPDFSIDSPVLKDLTRINEREYRLKLAFATKILTIFPENLNNTYRLEYLGSKPMADSISAIWPRFNDERFHEQKIGLPFDAYLYQLDPNLFSPEPKGFWTKGVERTQWIILTRSEWLYWNFKLHSRVNNSVKFKQGNQSFKHEIVKDSPVRIELEPEPLNNDGSPFVYLFELECDSGYIPVLQDSTVRDSRNLGIFVDFGLADSLAFLAPGAFVRNSAYCPEFPEGYLPGICDFLVSAITYLNTDNIELKRELLPELLLHRPLTIKEIAQALNIPEQEPVFSAWIRNSGLFRMTRQSNYLDLEAKRLGIPSKVDYSPEENLEVCFKSGVVLEKFDCAILNGNMIVNSAWSSDWKDDRSVIVFIHVVPVGESRFQGFFNKVKNRIWIGRKVDSASNPGCGLNRAAFDVQPIGNYWPSSFWIPEETYLSQIQVPLDLNPGEYEVRLGIYYSDNGEKISTGSGEKYFTIRTILNEGAE